MSTENAKVRVGRLATTQFGRVARWQLERLRVVSSTVAMWGEQGYLFPVLAGVFGVGHAAASVEADLAAALLYAGPGAALSHATAAWWLGLLDAHPRVIHVSTPRRCRSLPGIRVHGRRDAERVFHKRLPVTTLPQTLLDLAASAPLRTLRRALANADYRGSLDLSAIEAAMGRGRRGSGRLRTALERHQPRLAQTRSGLEIAFLELCEEAGFVIPATNQWVAGWEVDALWRAERIAVELDGGGNHRTPAQMRRDRRKDLALRSAGFTPVRYSDEQIEHARREVIADLRSLNPPAPWA